MSLAWGEDVEDTTSSSEDEVFFGPILDREAKLIAKYAGRRTEIIFHGVSNTPEFDTSVSAQEGDDVELQEEDFNISDGHEGTEDAFNDSIQSRDDVECKVEMLEMNDSLIVHRRRSQHDVSVDDYCISETSMEDVGPSIRESSRKSPDEHSNIQESPDYTNRPVVVRGLNAMKLEITFSDEYITLPSQSSYESHYVSALETMDSTNGHKARCIVPAASVPAESPSDDDDKEDFGRIESSHCDISGVQSLHSMHMFEDSLSVNLSEVKSELDYCADQSDIKSESEMDISAPEKFIQLKNKLPAEKHGIAETASDVNEDKSCQTSFLFCAPPPPLSNGIVAINTRNDLKAACAASTLAGSLKKSRLPTPTKRADGKDDLKSKQTLPSLEKQQGSAKPLPGWKPPPRVPVIIGSKMQTPKQKYGHIRSPIAAYIHDDPPQPLIQNIKPKASRNIHFGLPSQKRNKFKISNLEKKQPHLVKSDILKENHDNFAVLPPAITIDEVREIKTDVATDPTNDDDYENVAPFKPPLPYMLYKGSKIMVDKTVDKITKQCGTTHTSSKIPSPRPPIVIKHTGQHKKIQWAKSLINKQQETYSPSRPTGVAPQILIKGFDLNHSVADDPNTVDASIVEVVDAKRTNTLYNK